jgi:hypothetical protein
MGRKYKKNIILHALFLDEGLVNDLENILIKHKCL